MKVIKLIKMITVLLLNLICLFVCHDTKSLTDFFLWYFRTGRSSQLEQKMDDRISSRHLCENGESAIFLPQFVSLLAYFSAWI